MDLKKLMVKDMCTEKIKAKEIRHNDIGHPNGGHRTEAGGLY